MIKEINIEEYRYNLPENKIAQFPLADRASSKLLVYNKGEISERKFSEITGLIKEKSFLIFNNTKVINARIFFRKETGAKIEIFCLEPANNKSIEVAFSERSECEWKCMVGNASKWRNERLKKNFSIDGIEYNVFAEKTFGAKDDFTIKFSWNNGLSFADVINEIGCTPLPPYIKRFPDNSDELRYQTVYADVEGSVAAPTAGLHFTEEILSGLKNRNVLYDFVTLNVGAGTFRPMKSESVTEHRMHCENFIVKKTFLENLIKFLDKPKTAVGTTSVRTLESLYWLGALPDKISDGNFSIEQWEVYEDYKLLPDTKSSLHNLVTYLDINNLDSLEGKTSLMIVPGYEFKLVDSIITNFHLPASTLLLLISAFTGKDWEKIYDYALTNDFRFLSYGDSSILTR